MALYSIKNLCLTSSSKQSTEDAYVDAIRFVVYHFYVCCRVFSDQLEMDRQLYQVSGISGIKFEQSFKFRVRDCCDN